MSLKKKVLKFFSKFSWKHLGRIVFSKVAGLQPATLLIHRSWYKSCLQITSGKLLLAFLVVDMHYEGLLLRENCSNTDFFLVLIFPHSDSIRRDTPYLSECGKIQTRKNSVFGHFSRILYVRMDTVKPLKTNVRLNRN